MLDLERIRRDLVACRDIPWSCACVEPEQLAALIEEVERLRGFMWLEHGDDFLIDKYGRIVFTDSARARGWGPPLPADPFDDTVPMLPHEETK